MDYLYLNEAYTNQKKSTYQIARDLNVSPAKVSRLLRKFGIPIRDKSEAQSSYLNRTNKHPTKGTTRSEETKSAIGKGVIQKWEEKPEEEKQKFVERGKKNYEKNGVLLKQKGHAGVRLSSKKGSKLELYLEQFLRERNIKVEFHKNMLTNQKLEVDMYLPEYKTVIEINGPSHYLPIRGEDKLIQQQKADFEKMGLITAAGFLYIRVKNLKDYSLSRYFDVANRVHQVLTDQTFELFSKKFIELEL